VSAWTEYKTEVDVSGTEEDYSKVPGFHLFDEPWTMPPSLTRQDTLFSIPSN